MTIVATLPASVPAADRDPDATVVFASDFEQAPASTAEALPTGWTRRRDEAHPHYLFVGLSGGTGSGRACLRMDLDGSAAEVTSPIIPLDPQRSYFVEALVRTEGLTFDRALVSLVLRAAGDRQHAPRVVSASAVSGTTDWMRVTIGPIDVDQASDGQIALQLGPAGGGPEQFDLTGRAWFDDVRVIRLPRMQLETASVLHLYPTGDEVEVRCAIWGTAAAPRLSIALEDARNSTPPTPTVVEAEPINGQASAWTWRWHQPFERPGYYRLHVNRLGPKGVLDQRTVGLAVADPRNLASGPGDFGWSLPAIDPASLSEPRLRLLDEAGLGWVKVPLWPAAEDPVANRRVVDMLEALRQRRIGVLGQVDPPPAAKGKAQATAAAAFAALADPQFDSLAGVLARFGLQVGAWQFGVDGDTTIARETDPAAWRRLAGKIDEAAGGLRLGVVWPLGLAPPVEPWPWKVVALEARGERDDRLLMADIQAARERQLTVLANVDGPAVSYATTLVRAEQLLHRLIDLKVAGAGFIGLSQPFATAQGVMTAEGSCGELFLPWRTTSQAIGGCRYAGRWRLPGGSENRVFLCGPSATIAIWNTVPTQEQLFLGDDAIAIDAFGARRPMSSADGRQSIDVERLPMFVVNLDAQVAAWRLDAKLEHERFPSVFGIRRKTSVQITNTFARAASGSVKINTPHQWKVSPSLMEFEAEPGATVSLPVELSIPLSGTTGEHLLRAEFDLSASGGPRFESWLPVTLAEPDLELFYSTTIAASGDLEVTQRLVNTSTTPASFHTNLFAPGERRLRHDVHDLAGGENVQVYRIPDGARFHGKTLWLRVEEIGGPRVLSYRFVVP